MARFVWPRSARVWIVMRASASSLFAIAPPPPNGRSASQNEIGMSATLLRKTGCRLSSIMRCRSTPAELRALVLASRAALAAREAELNETRAALAARDREIEALKLTLLKLRRMQFGRSSEKLTVEIGQLELLLEELESEGAITELASVSSPPRQRPARRPLPAHLPRESVVHTPACTCPDCGGTLRPIGESVSEMLEYVPARFKVIRHVRPKLACDGCEAIIQAPAASRPIARGLAGPGLLAHVLVSKYADH